MHYYEIRSGVHEYYVSHVQEDDRDTITFGGRNKCVVINVELNNVIAYMSIAQFDEQCKLNGDLQRKVGTVHLIKVAMKFVCKLYPHLSGAFKFDDKSSIICNEGMKLGLPILYWAVYGKTWYEKHLQAYIVGTSMMEPKVLQSEYKNALKSLKKKLKTKPDIQQLLKGIKQKKRDYLISVYEKCVDLKSFIMTFKRKHMDCSIYEHWLKAIVKEHMGSFEDLLWQIDYDPNIKVEHVKSLTEKPKDMFMIGGYFGMKYMFKGL